MYCRDGACPVLLLTPFPRPRLYARVLAFIAPIADLSALDSLHEISMYELKFIKSLSEKYDRWNRWCLLIRSERHGFHR